MKNSILFGSILVVVFLTFQIVMAVPAAPSPTCKITANIVGIEKTRTNFEGRADPPRQDFDYYKVRLKILEITIYKQEGTLSCDSSYIASAEKSGQILSVGEYDKNLISVGQTIKAKIHFGGDEWFSGYFLSDVEVVTERKEPQSPLSAIASWVDNIVSAILGAIDYAAKLLKGLFETIFHIILGTTTETSTTNRTRTSTTQPTTTERRTRTNTTTTTTTKLTTSIAPDLTGTWVSRVSGRGVVSTEKTPFAECRYWADVKLKLMQKGNIVTGTIQLWYRGMEPLNEESKGLCFMDPNPPVGDIVDVSLSGNRLRFRGTFIWDATFTTDTMDGTNIYSGMIGPIEKEGEFHLVRQQ